MNISDFLTSITDNLNFIVRSVILGLLFGILVSYLALDTYKINSRLISLSGELNPIDLVYEPYILTKLQLSGIDRSLEYPYLKYNKHNEILTIVSDNKDTISDDLDLILKTALDDHISRAINEARDIISELKKAQFKKYSYQSSHSEI